MTNTEIANMIDHTILKATATLEDVEKLCQEAIDNNFASVCINPCWVKAASQYLKANKKEDYQVKTCTVIGFPLGANTKDVKVFETVNACEACPVFAFVVVEDACNCKDGGECTCGDECHCGDDGCECHCHDEEHECHCGCKED